MTVRVRDVVAYGLAVKPPKVSVHDAVVYAATPRVTQVRVHDAVVYGAAPPAPRAAVGDAQALILTNDIRPANIYDVSGLVLMADPTPPRARKVLTSVLMDDPARVPNWNIKGIDWVKGLLVKDFGQQWLNTDLVFSDPQVLAGQFNSNVKLTVPKGSKLPYSGSMRMRYNRWSIAKPFETRSAKDLTSFGSSVVNSLAAINAAFGLALVAEDVVDAPISAGTTQITLTIASGSFMFIPGTSVVLGGAATLASNMTSLDLDGFDPA